MLCLKKNCSKLMIWLGTVDRLSLDVDSLKLRSSPHKHDINESLKAMRISIDECKERTARMCAKKDSFIKACSSSFHENNDDDLKVIDASPIRSMFCNMNFDDYGSDDESTFPRRRPKNSESLDLDVKFGKSFILTISVRRINNGLQQGNTTF